MNILKQEGIIMEHVKFVNMVTEAICKLEAQGELSKEDIGSGCHYRMNKGDKTLCCIVGHMMPDDTTRYHADIRYVGDSGISTLYEKDFYWTKKFTKDQICVLD
jgi:hypothetical protein